MKINCIIVDDEPLAADLLKRYASKIEHLEVLQVFHNALEAYTFLQTTKVEVAFLDIHMPRLNGLDLVQSLTELPKIIFTTAYREYAVEGFELAVVDYLVKPIRFDRFLKAVSRVMELLPNTTLSEENERPHLFFRVNKKMVKVYLEDILWIESMRDYVKINLGDRVLVTYRRISQLEKTLPHHLFLRIHKSYIIALQKIESYTHNEVKISSQSIPIGRIYKQRLMNVLTK